MIGRHPAIWWLLSTALAFAHPASLRAAGTVTLDTFDLPPGASVTLEFEVDISAAPSSSPACNQGQLVGVNVGPLATDDPDTGTPGDQTCTPLQLLADLAITKTDLQATDVPGTSISYTIVATNNGPSTDSNVTVADAFPAALTGCSTTSVAAGGATGNDPGPTAGNLNDTGISMPPSSSVTYTVNCNIMPGATGTLSNTATITNGTTTDPALGNNSATDNTTLTPQADVQVTKTDGSATEIPGTPVTYTITVSNAGPSTDPNVTASDTFPGILSGCSTTSVAAGGASGNDPGPTAGNLNDTGIAMPPGSSVTYTVSCNVDPAATGSLSNTASASASVTDPVAGNNSATDTDTLTPQADLQITKTDGAASEIPGTPVTYTITVSNAGPSRDPNVTVADTFVAALTGCSTTSVAAGGATGNDAGPVAGDLNDTAIDMPPGSSVTYTATCNIAPTATGSLTNTATVAASVTDPTPGNNSATDTDTLTPQVDVSVTKTDDSATEIPGTPVTYTITVANSGPSTDPNVTVTDTFAAILTGCSTTSVPAGGATGNDAGPTPGNLNDGGVSLPPSSSVTYTATCNINAAATGSLVNTATVTASLTDTNGANNTATDTDTLTPQADLSITKTDEVTSVSPGGTVDYTIVVMNNGPSDAVGITVVDTFPGTLTGCTWMTATMGTVTGHDLSGAGDINDSGINMAAGAKLTYTTDLDSCVLDGGASGTLVNTATANGATADPNSGNNSATDTDTILPLDFGDAPTAAQSGFLASYPTLAAADGARHVATGLTLGDERDIEADGQPTVGADGDDTTGTPDDEDGVVFTTALIACQSASVEATASASGGRLNVWIDWNRDGDWGDANEHVTTEMALVAGPNAVNFTVPCDVSPGTSFARFRLSTQAGLTFDDQASDGEVEDYAVTVIGLDYGDAPHADPGPPTYPTVLADNGAHHAVQGPVLLGALRDTEPDGQPTANADGDDVTTSDDEDGVVFVSALIRNQNATIQVTTSVANTLLQGWIDWNADGDWSDAGEQVFTNQVIAAAGPNNLVVLVPSFVTPDSFSYARFRLTPNAPAYQNLGFTGYADQGEVEDHRIQFASIANLSTTKTDGASTAVPGNAISYTITVTNAGPSTPNDVAVTDTFPAELTGCSWTSVGSPGVSGNDAGPMAGNINDTGITMPPGSTVTYDVDCTIDPAATGTLSNTASVTSSAFDEDGTNNSSTDVDTLTPQADVQVTKTDGSATEVPGTPVTYTIVLSNAGPSVDPNVTLADTFPAALSGCSTTSVAAGGATGNDPGPIAGNVNDTAIVMPPGSTVTYTATCNIAPTATGTLVNTATATTSVTDPTPGNNSATDTDTLAAMADLQITKTDGAASEVPGTPVTYTIVVTNAGPSTDPNVTVADTFPASLSGCSTTSVAAGGATGNDPGPVAGNLNDTVIVMPPSSSVTYTATCNIAPTATGSLSNTATVTASVTDPTPGNNSATDTDTLTPQADVSITKTDGATNEVPGTPVTYTIVVSNAGPSTDPNVTVADTFAGILTGCSTTSVAAGGATGNDPGPVAGNLNDTAIVMPPSSSVTYTATCNIAPSATGSLTNTATATASVTDPTPGDNSATDTDTLSPETDLEIVKTADLNVVQGGEMFTYMLMVTNHGPSNATGVTITDNLPAEVTLVSTSLCAEDPNGIPTCTIGNLAANGMITIDVVVQADPAPLPNPSFDNTASVAGNETDPVPGNNSDTLTLSTDQTPPAVGGVSSAGGVFADCGPTVRVAIDQLDLRFSEELEASGGGPLGPNDADNPANYRLYGPGITFTASNCGPSGDPSIAIDSVTYLPDTPMAPESTAMLHLNGGASLPDGLYRLIACGTGGLRDLAGNDLDGDGDGNAGGDLVIDFRVDAGNLFLNGHFDCDDPMVDLLAPWQELPAAGPEVSRDAGDADGSLLSGSVVVSSSGGAGFGAAQCLEVGALANPYVLSSRVRVSTALSAFLGLDATCEPFSGVACAGSSLGAIPLSSPPLTDTAGVWNLWNPNTDVTLPPGTISVRCSFVVMNPGAASFDLYLDQLTLESTGLIFADGFESGDTSAWSSQVP